MHGRTHGKSGTPEYFAWAAMLQRCYRPTNPRYADYGGRGIGVCYRWRASFTAFLADMGERPTPKHSLDRIDNDGNYEPGNCRWATADVQTRNRGRRNPYTRKAAPSLSTRWRTADVEPRDEGDAPTQH